MTAFGSASSPGLRDGPNEDAVGTIAERGVWFIADGMGGHGHGETASGIVRDALLQRATADTLAESIRGAHSAILDAVRNDPTLTSMGSTVVACALSGSRCRAAWVGDSRAYLFRHGELTQLTVDHSLKQLLIAQGEYDPSQAPPDQDALVRALGMEVSDPSFRETPLRRRDLLLLCSDGLTHEVTDIDIGTILSRYPEPQRAADALVSQALANGGRDNTSVIVIAYDGHTDPALWFSSKRARVLLPLVGGALAAAACAIAWALLSGRVSCCSKSTSRSPASATSRAASVEYGSR